MIGREAKLIKCGDSQGIRIEKEELKLLGISDEDAIFRMVIDKGQIILTPKKKYPDTFEALFAEYEGNPLGSKDKFDWDEPKGRELL